MRFGDNDRKGVSKIAYVVFYLGLGARKANDERWNQRAESYRRTFPEKGTKAAINRLVCQNGSRAQLSREEAKKYAKAIIGRLEKVLNTSG
jgi:hypothetical protein